LLGLPSKKYKLKRGVATLSKSRKKFKKIEIYYLVVKKGFIINIEIYTSSIDYIVKASSSLPSHGTVALFANDKNKNKCVNQAIQNLYQLINV
jgi:hypothetical protein